MTLQPHSLSPLPEEQWDPRLGEVRAQLGAVLNVHRVMANHPNLMAAWTPLRQHIVTGGSLEPRSRELVILRVAHRTGVAYEWHHHVYRARAAGLTAHEIEAVRLAGNTTLPAGDLALLIAVDELLDSFCLSEATRLSLEASVGVEGILDVLVTVGMYVTLAMLINTAGIEIEGDL